MRLPLGCLTPRQRQMFKMWNNGMSEKKIADRLSVSKSCVNTLVKKAVDKLYNFKDNVKRYKEILAEDYKRRRRKEPNTLSTREREVLRHWKIQGWETDKICKSMNITRNTLKVFQQKIRRKVDISELESKSVTTNSSDVLSDIESDSIDFFGMEDIEA